MNCNYNLFLSSNTILTNNSLKIGYLNIKSFNLVNHPIFQRFSYQQCSFSYLNQLQYLSQSFLNTILPKLFKSIFGSIYKLNLFILIFCLPTITTSINTSYGCKNINKIIAHTDCVSALKVSFDDKMLASIGNDTYLRFWNLSQTNNITKISQFITNNTIIQNNIYQQYLGLDLSQNNTIAVVAGNNKRTLLLNITDPVHPQLILTISTGFILNSVVFANSGNRIIMSGQNTATPPQASTWIYDYNGTNWNNNTDETNNFYRLKAIGEFITANSSKLIIMESDGMNVLTLNPFNNLYETTYFDNNIAVRAILSSDENILIFFQPQGPVLLIFSYQRQINRYNLCQVINDTTGSIKDIYLSPNTLRLVLVEDDSSVNIYQYNSAKLSYIQTQTITLDSGAIAYQIIGNSIGTYLYVGDSIGNIYTFQCCPSIFQNISTNCTCNIGYKNSSGICQCQSPNFDPTNNCSTCIFGYYLSAGNCTLCNNILDNCIDCLLDGSMCTSCIKGFSVSVDGKCIACYLNCDACSSDGKNCYNCAQGYTNSAGNCTATKNTACLRTANNGKCTTCDIFYFLNSDDKLCYKCSSSIIGCLTCSSNNTCISCDNNYKLVTDIVHSFASCICKAGYYADTNTTCSLCVVYRCSDCDITNRCYSCAVGYYFDYKNVNCCQVQNCATCITNGICTICAPLFYLNNNNTCQSNSDIKNCKNYTTNGCSTCMVSFYLDTQNYCCSSKFCLNCTLTNSTCQTCLANYYTDQSGNCCPVENCANCSASQSNCTACKSGYYLNQSGMCANQSTIKFCTTYNASGCQICNTNYFVDSNNYCCLSNNCASCSLSSPTCLNCALNYTLDTFGNCCNTTNCSTCNATTAICSLCVTGFYLDSNHSCQNTYNILNCLTYGANGCTECNSSYNLYVDYCCITTNCAQCLINSTCVNCQSGYFLSIDQFCVNTDNCNITYSGICLNCSINYFLNTNNSCVAYSTVPKCIKFDNFGCTTCQSGYYYANQSGNCCTVENCANCSASQSNCTACKSGYYLNQSGMCANQSTIKFCTTYNASGCQICNTNYFVDSNNYCCLSNNCASCSLSSPTCLNCALNYTLDTFGNCCNTTNCSTCNATTAICSLCVTGFYLDSNHSCQNTYNILNCLTYGANGCTECNSSYNLYVDYCCITTNCAQCLINSTCVNCQSGYFLSIDQFCVNTDNCNITYSGICLNCSINYFLNTNNSCVAYSTVPKCIKFDNFGCTTCQSGYYYANQSGNCCTVENCANCSASQSNCTACKSGYYLNQSGMCANQSTIKFCTTYNASGCQICSTNYFVDSNNYCCSSNNCASCSLSSPTCLNCALNYTLDTFGNCCNTTNCSTCNATTAICSLCVTGFYLNSNHSCQNTSNILNCLTYGANGCTKCNSSYNLYVDYCCITTNCAQCLINSTCVNCQSGYFLSIDQFCVNTDNCNITYSGICLNCSINYFLNTNNSCVAYSTVPKCIKFDNFGCTACQSGYYLDSNNYCTTSPNCSLSNINNQLCTRCISGYYLNSTSYCQQENILQCQTYDIQGCVNCKPTYSLKNNICCANSLIGCSQCNSSNPSLCSVCSSGFTFNTSNLCQCNQGYNLTSNGNCVIFRTENSPTITPKQTASGFQVTTSLTPINNYILNSQDIQKSTTVTLIFNQNQRKLTQQTITIQINSIIILSGNQVILLIENPPSDLSNIILILNINNPNLKQTIVQFKIEQLYGSSTINSIITPTNNVSQILISILLFTMLIFYIFGNKYNHTINFIQKISFLRFNLPLVSTPIFAFLYSLKFSYFDYGDNALQHALKPDYLENSNGNFNFVDEDANIVRNVGIPILISIVLVLCRLFGLIIFRKFQDSQNIQGTTSTQSEYTFKKIYYRIIEYFQKTIMFPIIFFSIAEITFFNIYSSSSNSAITNTTIYNTSVAFSIIYIIYFVILKVVIFLSKKISKYTKLQFIGEYIFDLLDSIIIIQTFYTNSVLTLIIIIVTKGVYQFYLKYAYANISKWEFLKIISICFQITIIVILANSNTTLVTIQAIFVLVIIFDLIYIIAVMISNYHLKKQQELEQKEGKRLQKAGGVDRTQKIINPDLHIDNPINLH